MASGLCSPSKDTARSREEFPPGTDLGILVSSFQPQDQEKHIAAVEVAAGGGVPAAGAKTDGNSSRKLPHRLLTISPLLSLWSLHHHVKHMRTSLPCTVNAGFPL